MDDGALDFPRGFVIGGPAPSSYVTRTPAVPGLLVHPWCEVASAADEAGRFVVVLGTCVPIDAVRPSDPARELLDHLTVSEESMFAALSLWAGRYAIVYGRPDDVRVMGDATGMRAVFYAEQGGIAASHALLVERALGGEIERRDVPSRYGHPGHHTPYARTRLLTPNTVLDLGAGRVRRYWPDAVIPERAVDDVARDCLTWASNALRNIAEHHPVRIAVTAGLDSRALVAVALHAGVTAETYTYGDRPDTRIDRLVAPVVAQQAGLPHTVLPTMPLGDDVAEALAEAHYRAHHILAVPTLSAWIQERNTVAVTANLLEIGRSFYKRFRDVAEPPVDPESMRHMHQLSMGNRGKAYAAPEVIPVAQEAFADWIEATDFNAARGLIDPDDQFYWEHRMGTWHGPAMVERDFYAEPFIPFNARAVFTAMLGIDRDDRDSGAVLHRLIDLVDPELHSVPINPKRWPPKAPARSASDDAPREPVPVPVAAPEPAEQRRWWQVWRARQERRSPSGSQHS
ncbi:hypothetical protein [Isoptericola croceus]|uniref:hypothetical protein n=1 Tax=Isoptericola croceus TaxID=3031406 RepID=UPI0023FA2088|nr:hypothetical protein [Isoptericola croceus]